RSAAGETHGDRHDQHCDGEAQHPVSLPCSGIASNTHVPLYKEGSYAPHEEKCHPAQEDDAIVDNHHLTRKYLTRIQNSVRVQRLLDTSHDLQPDTVLDRHEARLTKSHAMLAGRRAVQLQ